MYSVYADGSMVGKGLLRAMGPGVWRFWVDEDAVVGRISGSIVPGVVVDWRRGRKNIIVSVFWVEMLS